MNDITNNAPAPAPADTAADASIFYDQSELQIAMSDPAYATSARYRDGIAAKLQRSQDAGALESQTTYHTTESRVRTMEAATAPEGAYGQVQDLAKPYDTSNMSTAAPFAGLAEISQAVDAPSFDIDPTYRAAVVGRISRSIRAGNLDEATLAQLASWLHAAEQAVS